jgi:FMN-dependent NADH-azoreductase
MATILLITSSPRGADSISSKVAKAVVETLQEKNPGSSVVTRDLAAKPLPYLDAAFLGAVYTPEESRTAEQKAYSDLGFEIINEVLTANYIVIASALINFSVPATLRSWVDYLVRNGVTFKYGENGPVGVIDGSAKQVIFVEARGGVYAGEAAAYLHSTDSYLKGVLGWLGLTKTQSINIEGLAYGPEASEKAIAAALEQAKLVE